MAPTIKMVLQIIFIVGAFFVLHYYTKILLLVVSLRVSSLLR